MARIDGDLLSLARPDCRALIIDTCDLAERQVFAELHVKEYETLHFSRSGMIDPERLMRLAIDKCLEGISQGQTPFACAIARGDEILALEHNMVFATTDITAHAEIVAIRAACRGTKGILLESSTAVSTCEPCPMCIAALHWARVDTVYYGATIADADAAGFSELLLPARELVMRANNRMKLVPGILADDCRALFQTWAARDDHRTY